MRLRQPAAPLPPPASEDLLDSWKEIARFLNRDIRTIQRWERHKGLPVHRLPGGDKPAVYALKSEVNAWRLRERDIHSVPAAGAPAKTAPEPSTASVAVLPFANLSADKENEYFSDGLADEIITALTRVQGLRVTARTSSFALRDQHLDVREIGARLGVNALLEGSVQRSAGRLRISAQLVDVAEGFHLWSERYDRKLEDIFAIQDEIAHAIACALRVHLGPAARRTARLDAYNQWLKGRYYQQYEQIESVAKSRAYFEQAIALDPLFPQPHLGLADLHRVEPAFGTVRPRDVAVLGQAAIRRALDLDDSIGEAYALSGAYRAWIDFDWEGAAADFDRALALTPASHQTHALRALTLLVPTGRLEEAEREMERAIELDPLSPNLHANFGMMLNFARKFDRALKATGAALELRPDYAVAHWYRGAALWFGGRVDQGVVCLQRAMDKMGANPAMIASIGLALGLMGRKDEARAMLAQLEAAACERYITPIGRAWVHLGLGEFDAALEWLDHAVEERDPHILPLASKPIYDPLRSDPRFTALLRKMRLA